MSAMSQAQCVLLRCKGVVCRRLKYELADYGNGKEEMTERQGVVQNIYKQVCVKGKPCSHADDSQCTLVR
jgi:hypothetical protein